LTSSWYPHQWWTKFFP